MFTNPLSRKLQVSQLLSVLAICTLTACEQPTSSRSGAPPAVPITSDHSEKLNRLEQQVSSLESRIDLLERGEFAAAIKTDESLYGLVRTRHGTFTIAAKDIAPYLDGFKVKLDIGNLTSASFAGAEISVAWGSSHRKQFKVLNNFRPGAFTQVEVALTPAKSEDLKLLVVGISVNELILQSR